MKAPILYVIPLAVCVLMIGWEAYNLRHIPKNPMLTTDNLKKIKVGMAKDEVTALLGKPSMVMSNGHGVVPDEPHWGYCIYDSLGSPKISLVYQNNKVTEVHLYSENEINEMRNR